MSKYVSAENNLPSMAEEPLVLYNISTEPGIQHEEGLYAHEDVFREFARRLNQRIGTTIPV